ncbi:cobalt/nickel transport system permease protein [Geobacter sp. DSM 9736]|nr:cobalt/nickel transport system permease protein [Geobacter sp. DSM 9736]
MPSNNLLSGIDARLKLLCAVALLLMVLSCPTPVFPAMVCALGVAGCLCLRVPSRLLLLRFLQPMVIALVVLLLKLFSGHEPLFSLSLFGITLAGHADGLREGTLIATRIAGAVSVVMTVGLTTSFTDLMAALSWMRVPRVLIEVALFAWRYLFLFYEEGMVIYQAQKNRLGYTGYRRSLSSFGTLAGSLVIKAFDNSQTITTAMMQRGYDGKLPLLQHEPFRVAEVMWCCAFLLMMGFIWKT